MKESEQKSLISSEEMEYLEVSFLEFGTSDSDFEAVAERVKDLLEGCQQKLVEIWDFQVGTHDNTCPYNHAFHAHCVSGF